MPWWFVLVGSGYLDTLNLVSLVGVLGRFVVGVPLVNVPCSSCPGWKWLPACLGGWCVLVCLGGW